MYDTINMILFNYDYITKYLGELSVVFSYDILWKDIFRFHPLIFVRIISFPPYQVLVRSSSSSSIKNALDLKESVHVNSRTCQRFAPWFAESTPAFNLVILFIIIFFFVNEKYR